MTKKGFTLVEIMIVVAIIAVLVTIAIINLDRIRDTSQKEFCIANLRQIYNAKSIWAFSEGKQMDDVPGWDDLVPDYLANTPVCPAGGTYNMRKVDDFPVCSKEGHTL